MTVQAAHDQLLVDVLTELQALRVDLASVRRSTPPPPFDDEPWFPFVNSSQKRGVHIDGDRGRFWCFWSFRLYLGALWCIYFWLMMYLSWCIYFFLWVVYVRGRHFVFCFYFFYCFLFHVCYIGYWLIHFMRLFMIYVFYFLFCEINNLFCFTCIFHTCVYVFVECFRNIQVDSVVLLSTLATDRL